MRTDDPPHEATLRQIEAADPAASTWLSANAGSGKTRVLTDRVARLLLAGTPPQNILCLTYTNAAAGEMQNRLFDRLGAWAMLPDASLRRALLALGAEPPGDLGRARTLFARALETPGGLRVQTIHAFCAGLLRQFPLEAGVSPQIVEMDEIAQEHLLMEVFETLAEDDPGGIVADLARVFVGDEIVPLLKELAGRRAAMARSITPAQALRSYGAPEDLTEAAILDRVGWDAPLVARLCAALEAGSVTDRAAADRLAELSGAPSTPGELAVLERVFLHGAKHDTPYAPRCGKFPTARTRAALGADAAALEALMERVSEARRLRCALAAARRTKILHRFAAGFLPAYASEKVRRGWLDFDDLIEKATALLSEREAAQWVLWRLDGGIDHILVDESQDTSPVQWRIVEALIEEFAAGEGARDTPRTLFVVGDRKQSIYSFQGADAQAFERVRKDFADRMRSKGGMQPLELTYSFRSAPAILQTVDRTFEGAPATGLGGPPRHLAFANRMPGRVDLWPLVPKAEPGADGNWSDPVDLVAPSAPSALLAQRIADEIARMIGDPDCRLTDRDGRQRRVTAGDVLILVRGRTGAGELFPRIIQACKTRGLDVAGADVMKLGEELAVRDLTALLSFLALDDDDLSLAAVLRSPLFGWSEDALYRLAQDRGRRRLWQALRDSGATETLAVLHDLRAQADFLRPFDLLERILIRHDGRRRLVARLGIETEDGIDELLNLALSYERQEVPSLTGFLVWLESTDVTVKRHLEQNGGKIRVMTVHGAKGLEAPIVILPDTVRAEKASTDTLLIDPDGVAHWRSAASDSPEALTALAAAATDRAALERDRLLYVAMTRAESWLIACGAGDPPKGRSWYGDIAEGLRGVGAVTQEFSFGSGLRFETEDWRPRPLPLAPPAEAEAPPLPDWAERPAPPPPADDAPRAPSDLGGAKALAGTDSAAALRLGSQMHLLLEHLPGVAPGDRPRLAADLLASGELAASQAEAEALAAEVGRLLERPELASLFDPEALAEVDLSAHLPEIGIRIRGAVDRLVVGPGHVLAVDFKTNATVPDRPEATPEGLLRQMGAYRSGLSGIFPDRRVEVAILWTRSGTLMRLPDDIVMSALERAAKS